MIMSRVRFNEDKDNSCISSKDRRDFDAVVDCFHEMYHLILYRFEISIDFSAISGDNNLEMIEKYTCEHNLSDN